MSGVVNRRSTASDDKLYLLAVALIIAGANICLACFLCILQPIEFEGLIRAVSAVAVVEVVVSVAMWTKATEEFASPFVLFYLTACLFCMGQSLCWTFGIEMGDIDLLKYIPSIDPRYIFKAQIYSVTGMSLFFLGSCVALGSCKRIRTVQTRSNLIERESYFRVATILLVISFPFALLYLRDMASAVAAGGYAETYGEYSTGSKVAQFIPLLASLFPVTCLLKYAQFEKTNKRASRIALAVFFAFVAVKLYIGGRSGAIMLLLAFVVCKQYLGTPFSRKQIVPILIIGYCLLGILNSIKVTRTIANHGVLILIETFIMSLGTVIGDFVGELGWSMSSLAWTMQLIDSGESFRYGLSYLFAPTAAIPNFGFWDVHPVVAHSNLSEWMQGLLRRTTGLGYTFMAEAYANFSWGGLVIPFVIGVVFQRFVFVVNRENAKYNYGRTVLIILGFASLLKPFVRSTLSACMRPLVFNVILIIVLAWVFRKKASGSISFVEKDEQEKGDYESWNSDMAPGH